MQQLRVESSKLVRRQLLMALQLNHLLVVNLSPSHTDYLEHT
jgi:hypothetical protein